MQLEHFYALLTREGKWALESAMAFDPREKDFLGDFKMLAKRFPRELARAALTVAILRIEAEDKFPQTEKLYFTREALEQATPWEVASYRAQRYQGVDRIFDLGCSVGGDALALAQSAPVVGVDLDEVRLAMARENLRAVRRPGAFLQADITALPFTFTRMSGRNAIFFDPARRENYQRIHSVFDYLPPLTLVESWLPDVPEIAVKVSPGVNLDELTGFDCEVEFISLNGNLKEACLWFGGFKTAERRATLLVNGATHTLTAAEQPELPISEPRAYLYEPDPAILRAGLVQAVGGVLDAAQLDPEIAYLTSDTFTDSPWTRVWPVEDWMPFQLKNLRAILRERNVGSVTVKKRGSPIVPEELIQQLRLEGDESRTLFLTMQAGNPIVVIAGDESNV
jgi:SAM-dependent methyltransferase